MIRHTPSTRQPFVRAGLIGLGLRPPFTDGHGVRVCDVVILVLAHRVCQPRFRTSASDELYWSTSVVGAIEGGMNKDASRDKALKNRLVTTEPQNRAATALSISTPCRLEMQKERQARIYRKARVGSRFVLGASGTRHEPRARCASGGLPDSKIRTIMSVNNA